MTRPTLSRRTLIGAAGAGLAAAAFPVLAGCDRGSATAKKERNYRIGLMHVGLDHEPPNLAAIREALTSLGYREGNNLVFDFRNLENDRAAEMVAREFAREKVDLIVTFENPATRAAKEVAGGTPIVFVFAIDPVGEGFVDSFARPGGTLTGMTLPANPLVKGIELFPEIIPGFRRLLLIQQPGNLLLPGGGTAIRDTARAAGIEVLEREAVSVAEAEAIVEALAPGEVDGIAAVSRPVMLDGAEPVISRAMVRRVPVYGAGLHWLEAGALFLFEPDHVEDGRMIAGYIDQILRGTKPADLPVQRSDRFLLTVNLRAAETLGLTIPRGVLIRASRVMQ